MGFKLSQEAIDNLIEEETFLHHDLLTICVLDLTTGAQVIGSSNVISADNYDAEIGKQVAREDAKAKIWELEGYAVKTRGF